MNNPIHSRFIEIKSELARIPQATVHAIGQALADNHTVADAITLLKTSAQDAASLRADLTAVQKSVADLEAKSMAPARSGDWQAKIDAINNVELPKLSGQIAALVTEQADLAHTVKCLVGLGELGECIESWHKDNWKAQNERLSEAHHLIEKPMSEIIADDPGGREAWQELGQSLPKGQSAEQILERRAQLQACLRKLRFALLRQS
jgi:hypothetical protein